MTAQMPSTQIPTVALAAASGAELDWLEEARLLFERFGLRARAIEVSAWKDPRALAGRVAKAEGEGVAVWIAAAGEAVALPGMIAASGRAPVIAVPLAFGSFSDAEVTQLTLETAPTAPVLATEPGGALNAALAALRILSLSSAEARRALEKYHEEAGCDDAEYDSDAGEASSEIPENPAPETEGGFAFAEDPVTEGAEGVALMLSDEADESATPIAEPVETGGASPVNIPGEDRWVNADDDSVELRPAPLEEPLDGPVVRPSSKGPQLGGPPRKLGRRLIDSDDLDPMLIEDAVDCLLEGGVIALPTETVYGLAVDATNPAAVERLFEAKGRPRHKAVSLMIDSPRLLAMIARNMTTECRRLMEAFWPGPLTLIMDKRGQSFRHISDDDTIGVRLPDHNVPLALVQALARPLACTSANFAGQPDCRSADDIEAAFGQTLDLILDAGPISNAVPPSTVLDLTHEPYRVLREGSITHAQLAMLLGDKLDGEA